MRRKVPASRAIRLAVLGLLVLGMLVLAMPAQGLFFIWPQSISGHVTDNHGDPIKGLVVEVASTDGKRVDNAITDAAGYYWVGLPPGTYTAKFSDPRPNPTQIYATRWFDTGATAKSATPIVVAASANVTADEYVSHAVRIRTVMRRAGHPLTSLSGITVVVNHRDSDNVIDTFTGTTGPDGSVTIGGMALGDFEVQALDPSGVYSSAWVQGTWLTLGSNTTTVLEASMGLAVPAMDVAVTAPSAKSTVKKNKAFKSSGRLSKRVAAPTKMKIVAYRKVGSSYVPWKTFSAKIVKKSGYSTYSASVKLKAGKYQLYGLFPGSADWATANSIATAVTAK
jgi:hypothetical protein